MAAVVRVAQFVQAGGTDRGVGRDLARCRARAAGGAVAYLEAMLVRRVLFGAGQPDVAHSGEGRCVGAQTGFELLDRTGRSGDLALHMAVDVGDPAVQAERRCRAVDERPEADALDDARHVETARSHAGLPAISASTVFTRGSTASAMAGERPVPSALSAPSTA